MPQQWHVIQTDKRSIIPKLVNFIVDNGYSDFATKA